MNVRECIKRIYQQNGLRGFYKGITASYFGISETMVHFVIYEALKKKLVSCMSIGMSIVTNRSINRLTCDKSDPTKAKQRAILLSSCLPVQLQKRSRRVSLIRMKSREPDCAKRAISTTDSGRRCFWCGRKRARRDFIAASPPNSSVKYPTQLS